MIELFKKYVDWKILAHFLENPTTSFHVKELARAIHVSPGSVSVAVKLFERGRFLLEEKRGPMHIYKLNLEHPAINSIKKAYGMIKVLEAKPEKRFLAVDENIISLALVGSYADGSYDERSDLDFLVITPSKRDFGEASRNLETELKVEVNISIFKLSQWRQLARRGDAFYKRVVENHVLLYGGGLG